MVWSGVFAELIWRYLIPSAVLGLGLVACNADSGAEASSVPSAHPAPSLPAPSAEPWSAPSASAAPSATASAIPDDPRPLHLTTQAELLALLPPFPPDARPFIEQHVSPGGFSAMNQGNPELASHSITRKACLEGLAGVELQTAEQRRICGHEGMVPIYDDGDPSSAKTCIDIFEFPNRACELPFVWAGPTIAQGLCKKLGKRLCKQDEWMLACDADPTGGERWKYAYGNELDLTACNTSKSKKGLEPVCDPSTVKTTWDTCHTDTEPSGAFPRCRSRLGVYDLHGNVAEAMTRWDLEEKETVSQLKGSAFFYIDVARKLSEKPEKTNYPDHCRHDPRWHVQPMTRAWHVNYHLGFRCCADVPAAK
ncbi:MAG: SUMF1/EgtB/PvdO family nonheme iron enzyme [Polyangiaceae bacterium]